VPDSLLFCTAILTNSGPERNVHDHPSHHVTHLEVISGAVFVRVVTANAGIGHGDIGVHRSEVPCVAQFLLGVVVLAGVINSPSFTKPRDPRGGICKREATIGQNSLRQQNGQKRRDFSFGREVETAEEEQPAGGETAARQQSAGLETKDRGV